MPYDANQSTLKAPFELSGHGLHTGKPATLRAVPAPAGTGFVFKRVDLPGQPTVKADLAHVTATERGTVVTDGPASAATIEHLLGAVYGLGVDNAVFEISGPEVPILDGSGQAWAQAVRQAGIMRQAEPRDFFTVGAFGHANGAKRLQAEPSERFEVRYRIDYAHAALGKQELHLLLDPESFFTQVAPARTFCFEHEVEALRKAGLIQGGSLDCALVLGEQGVLNPPVRFPDEFVRHKVLDFFGDLALSGRRYRGSFTLDRAGHGFHVEAVKALLNAQDGRPQGGKTVSDPAAVSLPMDVMAIQALLPHRPPFLLLDRVTALEPKSKATGWKNVTVGEWFFQGHFPGHPIYPGVLIVEGLAQCGGVLIMKSYVETQGKLTYFMSIDNCRFRRPVRPGDVLRYELEILKVKGPVSRLKGMAYVGEELAAEAELMCMSVAPDAKA
jgi:UDP-3-O-[3-hydroxymyristoyl] N-acetylglucosamine deacetylase/3-hydroxyacyl-[acyl-carrier-protein] dehydratase